MIAKAREFSDGHRPPLEKNGCCAPARAGSAKQSIVPPVRSEKAPAAITDGMREIPGGEFLMGSETDPPVHTVELSPFLMDATCVTNEQFNEFVNATQYKTEADRFGWSFVFFGHLTERQRHELVRECVQ